MSNEGHHTFSLSINYEGVRKGFQNDMEIYGGVIVRQIGRSGEYAEQVINPNDVHGFMAATNVALSCIDSQEAMNEFRTLFDSITAKIAEANRNRKEQGDDDEEDREDDDDGE